MVTPPESKAACSSALPRPPRLPVPHRIQIRPHDRPFAADLGSLQPAGRDQGYDTALGHAQFLSRLSGPDDGRLCS